jgi:hypothetical protein
MNEIVEFPTMESALRTIESYAVRSGIKPADVAEVFALGRAQAHLLNPALLGSDEPLVVTWGQAEPAKAA